MSKISVGLDLGFSSIKVVALSRDSTPPKLISLGSIAAPQPGMLSENEADLETVAKTIKRLLEASKIEEKEMVAALPESKVFSRVIDDLPYLSDNELPSAIRYASEEFIPLPLEEVELNWQILFRANEKGKSKTIVFVIATPKAIVNKYLKVFSLSGITLKALETEVIATSRSLVGNNPFSPTTLIIQLGANTSDLAVTSKGLVLLTRSISTGGIALSRSIARFFNFEFTQAEEYKKVYGLNESALGGKVFQALKPLIDIILGEVRRVIQAYNASLQERSGVIASDYESKSQDKIKRIVLSGGGAKMPGLVVYFGSNLGLEVQEADPWYYVAKDKEAMVKLAKDAPSYSVATGLALRDGV